MTKTKQNQSHSFKIVPPPLPFPKKIKNKIPLISLPYYNTISQRAFTGRTRDGVVPSSTQDQAGSHLLMLRLRLRLLWLVLRLLMVFFVAAAATDGVAVAVTITVTVVIAVLLSVTISISPTRHPFDQIFIHEPNISHPSTESILVRTCPAFE